MPGLKKNPHLTGCISEIIAFNETIDNQTTLYIHEYLMEKFGITYTVVSYRCLKVCRGE